MQIRKPTLCEKLSGARYAHAYDKLFRRRCLRAVNLTTQGVANSFCGDKTRSDYQLNASFDALCAAIHMKGPSRAERVVFKFNHGGLVNAELWRQISLISAMPLFEILAKKESTSIEH